MLLLSPLFRKLTQSDADGNEGLTHPLVIGRYRRLAADELIGTCTVTEGGVHVCTRSLTPRQTECLEVQKKSRHH